MMCMKDTRGRRSKTLFFVTVTWIAMLIKFIAAGVTITVGEAVTSIAPMGATEFGTGVAMVLAVWVGREWKDKEMNGSADNQS